MRERRDVKLNIMKSFTEEISLQVLVIYEYSSINLDKFLLRTFNYRYLLCFDGLNIKLKCSPVFGKMFGISDDATT